MSNSKDIHIKVNSALARLAILEGKINTLSRNTSQDDKFTELKKLKNEIDRLKNRNHSRNNIHVQNVSNGNILNRGTVKKDEKGKKEFLRTVDSSLKRLISHGHYSDKKSILETTLPKYRFQNYSGPSLQSLYLNEITGYDFERVGSVFKIDARLAKKSFLCILNYKQEGKLYKYRDWSISINARGVGYVELVIKNSTNVDSIYKLSTEISVDLGGIKKKLLSSKTCLYMFYDEGIYSIASLSYRVDENGVTVYKDNVIKLNFKIFMQYLKFFINPSFIVPNYIYSLDNVFGEISKIIVFNEFDMFYNLQVDKLVKEFYTDQGVADMSTITSLGYAGFMNAYKLEGLVPIRMSRSYRLSQEIRFERGMTYGTFPSTKSPLIDFTLENLSHLQYCIFNTGGFRDYLAGHGGLQIKFTIREKSGFNSDPNSYYKIGSDKTVSQFAVDVNAATKQPKKMLSEIIFGIDVNSLVWHGPNSDLSLYVFCSGDRNNCYGEVIGLITEQTDIAIYGNVTFNEFFKIRIYTTDIMYESGGQLSATIKVRIDNTLINKNIALNLMKDVIGGKEMIFYESEKVNFKNRSLGVSIPLAKTVIENLFCETMKKKFFAIRNYKTESAYNYEIGNREFLYPTGSMSTEALSNNFNDIFWKMQPYRVASLSNALDSSSGLWQQNFNVQKLTRNSIGPNSTVMFGKYAFSKFWIGAQLDIIGQTRSNIWEGYSHLSLCEQKSSVSIDFNYDGVILFSDLNLHQNRKVALVSFETNKVNELVLPDDMSNVVNPLGIIDSCVNMTNMLIQSISIIKQWILNDEQRISHMESQIRALASRVYKLNEESHSLVQAISEFCIMAGELITMAAPVAGLVLLVAGLGINAVESISNGAVFKSFLDVLLVALVSCVHGMKVAQLADKLVARYVQSEIRIPGLKSGVKLLLKGLGGRVKVNTLSNSGSFTNKVITYDKKVNLRDFETYNGFSLYSFSTGSLNFKHAKNVKNESGVNKSDFNNLEQYRLSLIHEEGDSVEYEGSTYYQIDSKITNLIKITLVFNFVTETDVRITTIASYYSSSTDTFIVINSDFMKEIVSENGMYSKDFFQYLIDIAYINHICDQNNNSLFLNTTKLDETLIKNLMKTSDNAHPPLWVDYVGIRDTALLSNSQYFKDRFGDVVNAMSENDINTILA